MLYRNWNKNKIRRKEPAQAIVEFAIVLPILLVVIIGLLEVGRMVFIYSAINNASRNAVRYASAYGTAASLTDSSVHYRKYLYCDGIKDTALKSAYLVSQSSVSVTIDYFDSTNTYVGTCNTSGGEWGGTVAEDITSNYIVKVTVQTMYAPMVSLVPLTSRPIIAENSRTILGIVNVK